MNETPETGWAAQPAETPHETYLRMVRENVTCLLGIAATLEDRKRLRLVAVREEMRRTLAGVIANCEIVRLALERR